MKAQWVQPGSGDQQTQAQSWQCMRPRRLVRWLTNINRGARKKEGERAWTKRPWEAGICKPGQTRMKPGHANQETSEKEGWGMQTRGWEGEGQVYAEWGDCVRERLDIYRPVVGEKEGPQEGRQVYTSQGQMGGKSGTHQPRRWARGDAGVPTFRQHPALPTSFSGFILSRFSFKLMVV